MDETSDKCWYYVTSDTIEIHQRNKETGKKLYLLR